MKSVLSFALFLAAVAAYGMGTQEKWAHCEFIATPLAPMLTGFVQLNFSDATGLIMQVSVQNTGLPDGLISIFSHMYGDMTSEDASATGPCSNANSGNWMVTNGSIELSRPIDQFSFGLIDGNSVVGRSIVLHNQMFTGCTPANAAMMNTRLAQCVVGVGSPASGVANLASNIDDPTTTVCVINEGPVSGTFFVTQETPMDRIVISGNVEGLSGNPHGLALYLWGQAGFEGPVWNPAFLPHGIPGIDRNFFRAGAWGNIAVYNGATASYFLDFADLDGMPNGLNPLITLTNPSNIIGRTIAIHQNTDDCSQPNGNVGPIIARCVLGTANPATMVAPVPANAMVPQDISACPVPTMNTVAPTIATAVNSGASLAAGALFSFAAVVALL